MKTRPLGKSGLEIPVVTFGAWQIGGWFWGPADENVGRAALHRALDQGMTAIDTAPAYGLGHSEEVIGRALQGRRREAILMTKCGLRWDDDRGKYYFDIVMPDGKTYPLHKNLRPDSVRQECERSLRRLGTDVIDLYQCHWPDPTTPIADTMGEMVKLYREGKIRAVGVSNFTPGMMDEAQAALGEIPLASDQPRYNLMDRRIEAELLPYLRRKGVGVVTYSSLEQGLLTGKVTEDRELAEGDLRSRRWEFSAENRRRINEVVRTSVMPIARDHSASAAQIAMAWVFHQPGVTSAIVGARSPDQVDENAAAGSVDLSETELTSLSSAFAALELDRPPGPS